MCAKSLKGKIMAINFSSAQLNLSSSGAFLKSHRRCVSQKIPISLHQSKLLCSKMIFFSNFTSIAFLKYHYIATFIGFREESWQWLSVLLNWESHQWLKVINAIAVILSNVIKQSRDSILSLWYFCPSKRPLSMTLHVFPKKMKQMLNSYSGRWGHRLPRF